MATNLELPEGFEVEYSPNEIPEGFEIEETPQVNNEQLYGRIGKPTYISAYKAPNVIDGLKNAWDFVTQVPYAAFMEQKRIMKLLNCVLKE